MFAYCGNNPVLSMDSTGEKDFECCPHNDCPSCRAKRAEKNKEVDISLIVDATITADTIVVNTTISYAKKTYLTTTKPNNVGAGKFADEISEGLDEVAKASKISKKISKIAPVIPIAIDVGVGIYKNIQNNESAGEIIKDALIDAAFSTTSAVASGFAAGQLGAYLGTAIGGPVGTLVGGVVGFGFGLFVDWVFNCATNDLKNNLKA